MIHLDYGVKEWFYKTRLAHWFYGRCDGVCDGDPCRLSVNHPAWCLGSSNHGWAYFLNGTVDCSHTKPGTSLDTSIDTIVAMLKPDGSNLYAVADELSVAPEEIVYRLRTAYVAMAGFIEMTKQ